MGAQRRAARSRQALIPVVDRYVDLNAPRRPAPGRRVVAGRSLVHPVVQSARPTRAIAHHISAAISADAGMVRIQAQTIR